MSSTTDAPQLPALALDIATDGSPLVWIGHEESLRDAASLAARLPALLAPAHASTLAALLNHLAHGYDYRPILDPEAFRSGYVSAYEAEAPDEDYPPGARRLRSFGLPRFEQIAPPRLLADGTLEFFAESIGLGIPYRARWRAGEALLAYEPVSMQ